MTAVSLLPGQRIIHNHYLPGFLLIYLNIFNIEVSNKPRLYKFQQRWIHVRGGGYVFSLRSSNCRISRTYRKVYIFIFRRSDKHTVTDVEEACWTCIGSRYKRMRLIFSQYGPNKLVPYNGFITRILFFHGLIELYLLIIYNFLQCTPGFVLTLNIYSRFLLTF